MLNSYLIILIIICLFRPIEHSGGSSCQGVCTAAVVLELHRRSVEPEISELQNPSVLRLS